MNDTVMTMNVDLPAAAPAVAPKVKLAPLQVLRQGLVKGSQYVLMFLGVFLSAVMLYRASGAPLPLLTKTPSLNPGWYLLDPTPVEVARRGDIVRWNFVPPQWLREAHPELKAFPYLKRVMGVPGDRVFWEGDHLKVCAPDGTCQDAGRAVPHDGKGHRFPRATFPDVIPPDQYLLIADHPTSMDGRYLGLMPINVITGRAREWMVEKMDYPALQKKFDAWLEKHPDLPSSAADTKALVTDAPTIPEPTP